MSNPNSSNDNNDNNVKKESILDTLDKEKKEDTNNNDKLIPSPAPKLHYEDQTNIELDKDKEIKKILDKKPHEMNDYELAMHLARHKEFKFLMVDDDGNYYERSLRRRAIKDKMREELVDIRNIYLNWRNIPKKFNGDKTDKYYNNNYYEVHDKKFYLQQDIYDYYCKLAIHYCFKIPMDDLQDFADSDDPEEMDNNERYCYKTIAKVCMEIGNVGLSFFPNI